LPTPPERRAPPLLNVPQFLIGFPRAELGRRVPCREQAAVENWSLDGDRAPFVSAGNRRGGGPGGHRLLGHSNQRLIPQHVEVGRVDAEQDVELRRLIVLLTGLGKGACC
jgi:hypothetical protein